MVRRAACRAVLAVAWGAALGAALCAALCGPAQAQDWKPERQVNLLGGHLDVVSASAINVVPLMKADRIRVIAVAWASRLADTPEWDAFLARNQWRAHYLGHDDAVKYLEAESAGARSLLSDLGLLKK